MVVTWGSNTTTVFGTGTAAASSSATAPALGGGLFGGAVPSTPPAASTPAPTNPPPLGLGLASTTATASTAPAPSTSSLWGQSAPAPSGGLFGSSTPAPAPPTGGLFGSTPAPASSGGLFGSASAPAPGGLFGSTAPAPTAGGLFGASTPSSTGFWSGTSASAAPTLGGFGLPQQSQQMLHANPHQSAMHAHQTALQRQETARIEKAIFHLHSSYSPHAADPMNPALASNNIPSSLCAFTAILYDPLPPEYRTQGGGQLSVPKPMHTSNQVWNEALARNPDPRELMPVALVGAAALHCRIVSQQEKVNALATHADKLRENLQFLERTSQSSRAAILNSNVEHEALRRRLLDIMRKVEIIRCMGQPIQRAEVEAKQRIGEIMKQVNVIGKSLANLEEIGKQQAQAWRVRGATIEARSDFGSLPLREEDKIGLFHVLNDQMLGMERLGRIVNRDVRDMSILKDELSNMSSSKKEKSLPSFGATIFGGR